MKSERKTKRCTATVHIRGLSFGHFRQCSRRATTTNADGERVCTQHSPGAEQKRRDNKAELQRRSFNVYLAYLHTKPKKKDLIP